MSPQIYGLANPTKHLWQDINGPTMVAQWRKIGSMATGTEKSISSQPPLMPGSPTRPVATNTTTSNPLVALGVLLFHTKTIPLDQSVANPCTTPGSLKLTSKIACHNNQRNWYIATGLQTGDNNQESYVSNTIHWIWPHNRSGGTPNNLAGILDPTTKKTEMGFQTPETFKQWPTNHPSHPEWPCSGSEWWIL